MSSATMPREEAAGLEGHEFELVLGNKQLLSVFFIVVILLGVFFTMGYVVGRNSTPVDAASRRTEPAYERQNAPSPMPAATPTPVAVKTEPAAAPKPIELPPVMVTQPQIGQTYLQVLAVAKPEAEVLADVLAKKGFRALVAPGPNDRVFRVLVGPARDTNEALKLRSDLEAAGFKPFVKKY